MATDKRYFVVDRDALGLDGSVEGQSLEDAQKVLDGFPGDDDLLVIQGELLWPTRTIPHDPE